MVAETCISAALERQRLVPFGHVLGEIAHERGRVDLTQHAGRLAHRDRAGAEALKHQAVAGKLLGARDEPLDVGFVELDDLGDQQDLARDAGLFERRLEALVDEAFVGGVLVDNDDAVPRLRHHVGFVHLRTRGAERTIDQVGRRRRRLVTRVGCRRADVEADLHGLGKALERGCTRNRERRPRR